MRSLLFALLLTACGPLPDPVEPKPLPPTPADGTPCERACDRLDELSCTGSGPMCVSACDRYEAEGEFAPALSWNPECIATAKSCGAAERCRGGQ